MNTADTTTNPVLDLSVTELARLVLRETPQLTRRQAIIASSGFLAAKASG